MDAVIFFSWPFDKKFATSISGTFSSFGNRSGLLTPSGLALAIWTAAKKASTDPLRNLVAFCFNSILFMPSFDGKLESALKLDLIWTLLSRLNDEGLKESTATAKRQHKPKTALIFVCILDKLGVSKVFMKHLTETVYQQLLLQPQRLDATFSPRNRVLLWTQSITMMMHMEMWNTNTTATAAGKLNKF